MSLRMDHDAGSRHAAGLFSPAATHRPGDGHALLAPVLVLNASYEPINVCAARRALGISDGFVRLSVGLEAEADLWADIELALI